MSYLKVKWNRSFPDEPMLLYSELDRERWEVRKVVGTYTDSFSAFSACRCRS
jgi:hypothetical protein